MHPRLFKPDDEVRLGHNRKCFEDVDGANVESIAVRNAHTDEIEKIVDVFKNHDFYSEKIDREEVLTRVLRRFPDLLLVAVKGDEIVGAVYGQADGRIGLIWKLFVLPEYRRKGIGTALVAEIVKKLSRYKCEGISLLIEKKNTAARKLYEKMGFEIWQDHVLMVLTALDSQR